MYLKSILAMIVFIAAGAPLAMGAVLDQSYQPVIDTDYNIHSYDLAQTVTAGVSGYLTEIDVPVMLFPQTDMTPWEFTIRATSGGVPTGTILATQTLPATSIPLDFRSPLAVDFSNPAYIAAGEQYAIALRSVGFTHDVDGAGEWMGSFEVPYSGGHDFSSLDGQAFNALPGVGAPLFQTFMEAPEPSSSLAVLVFVIGVLLRRSRPGVGTR